MIDTDVNEAQIPSESAQQQIDNGQHSARKSTGRSKDSSPVAVIGELNKIMKLKKRLKSAASKKQPITIEDAKEKRPPTAPLSILAGKKSYIDLKNEFGKHLPRLSSLDTRQTALKELGIVIESNKTPEGLRVFLSILTEYKRPQNFTSNEAEVFLIGIISDTFGTDLLDSLDNPPSLLSATIRLAQLVSKYFKDSNENVQRQCCKTWKQIYRSQLLNAPSPTKLSVLFSVPFAVILGGNDRVAQITSVMVLESTLELAQKLGDKELSGGMSNKYLSSVYFKMFLDTPSLVTCVKLIIEISQLKTMQIHLPQILQKTISFLLPSDTRPISYKIKSEACDLLGVIARHLQDLTSAIIGQYHVIHLIEVNKSYFFCYQDEIIQILQDACKDRTLKVQGSAKAALKEWMTVKVKQEELEKKKLTKKLRSKEMMDPDEIITAKTVGVSDQLAVLQKKPKQQSKTIVLENDLGMKNVLHSEGAWVKELKGKNFVRKQTGVGGGRTVLNQEKLNQGARERTAHNQAQRLRQMVLGQCEENKSTDETFNLEAQKKEDARKLRESLKSLKKAREEKNLAKGQRVYTSDGDMFEGQESKEHLYLPPQLQIGGDEIRISNNFYNSKVENLADIQKQQQKLVEDQLKLYDQDKNDSNINASNAFNINKNNASEFQMKHNYVPSTLQVTPFQSSPQFRELLPNQQESLEDTIDFNAPQSNLPQDIMPKSISAVWQQAMSFINQGEVESAFELILNSEDDIYLLRLLLATKMPLEKLKKDTAVRVMQRYLLIHKSQFVNRICLQFYQDSIESGLQEHLLLEDQREMGDTLRQLSISPSPMISQMANNIMYSIQQL